MTLFQRDFSHPDHPIMDAVTPGAEWVVSGEGIATRKYDGACCLIEDGKLWKRYDVRVRRARGGVPTWEPPRGFRPAQEPDVVTGHWPGWVEVGITPADIWYRDAFERSAAAGPLDDGTYEAMGPSFTGRELKNPEHLEENVLIRHGVTVLDDCPRTFEGLRQYLCVRDLEGIVWHDDGRMVKVKTKDFLGVLRGRQTKTY